jgi:hypothetical protein
MQNYDAKRLMGQCCPIHLLKVNNYMALENLEGIRLPGLFERTGEYIQVPFLDPENIKILRLGAIWNFGKGTGLSRVDIRL